ncbi:MAG: AAA family ATPase, partial [Acidibacillus sp.]|nr:AAA family ATPase [Acidibacillus sp.]
FTWVKMEKPNLEALRLALHDGEDGVLRSDSVHGDPNYLNDRFFITSVQITKGQKAGRAEPLKIDFSPWLNTIIGGRGSGKSSVIEYMRLPFNKTAALPQKIAADFNEFNQIPSERGRPGMLTADTEIRVEMRKDGRDVALTWKGANVIEEHRTEEHDWEIVSENSNIEKRFPLRIFSQKHLYTLTEDPNHILRIIDEQFDKHTWNDTRNELSKRWLKSKQQERELAGKVSSIDNLKIELSDIRAKMKIFEESGHKELLDEYQRMQMINGRLDAQVGLVEDLEKNMLGIRTDKIDTLFADSLFEGFDDESLGQLRRQARDFNDIKQLIDEATQKIVAYRRNVRETVSNIPWQKRRLENVQKYQAFVKLLEENGEKNPNAYSHLVNIQQEFEQKLTIFVALEDELARQTEVSVQLLKEIEEHEKLLRRKREETIKHWQGVNPNIRMYLSVMGDLESAEKSFRNSIRKTGSEFRRDLLERDDDGFPCGGVLFELGKAQNPWQKRTAIIKRLQGVTESNNQNFSKPFAKHILNMQPEDLEQLSTWYPEDKITLKIVENRKEEDIETGSTGQRTAAMLSLMLVLDDSPIIIDQPEEDLDTKRITDLVVKGLRDFKAKQQIIVITHNPNIPVNGAAENIIQMNFAGGQIQRQISGALQKDEVREAICEVMEGGKEALEKRYYRISRALDR